MPIHSESTYMELVTSYHQSPDSFIFFVGAGLSQPLFPSWGSLLKTFLTEAKAAGMSHNESEILSYIDNGESYLDIAEMCVTAIGPARYRDIIERVFDKDFSENEIPEAYKALINLSPKTIITTNYDRIPDIAGNGRYRVNTSKNVPEASRSFTNNKHLVFKIHGDVTDQSSIVLTSSDYQEIIHKNQPTRNFINSLLSTKILIFVGFSLSDPHINMILENIKTINNGIPLSHYVLLSGVSNFKASAFEKNYGVKVISYTPSNHSHPEVVEILRALSHGTAKEPERVTAKEATTISSVEDLIKHLNSSIENVIVGAGLSILLNNEDLYISFTASGETKGEVQKEILSIIKVIDFDCSLFNKINILVTSNTLPTIEFDRSQPIEFKASLDFSTAYKYANKEISTSTVWQSIEFYTPPGLSDAFRAAERVTFPISMGIIGEQP